MSVQCEPETLQLLLHLNLFRGLAEAELLLLLEEAELVDFAKDDCPIVEGEQGQFMFVILSGKVRIAKRSFGIQKQIGELGPGECFGEMSLIECRSRSASVKALGACKLLRIDGDKIARIPAIAAILYRNIAMLLSQRLRHANDILTLG
jgi:CRP-like cAMP-binding protein